MFGDPWPTVGEFDIYESWNLAGANSMTLHADHAGTVGACSVSGQGQTGIPATQNCDNYHVDPSINQWQGTGCTTTETQGQWGNPAGAVCK